MTHNRPIRILLFDEEPYARAWCAGLILRDPRASLAADCGEPQEALALANRLPVDLLLAEPDYEATALPPCSFLSTIRACLPGRPLICLSRRPAPELFQSAVQAGCSGYLLKRDIGPAVVSAALRASPAEFLYSPGVEALALAARPNISATLAPIPCWKPSAGLTPTQMELLRMRVFFGMRAASMADEASYQPGTVEKYMSQIYSILASSTDAARLDLEHERLERLPPEDLALLLFTMLPRG